MNDVEPDKTLDNEANSGASSPAETKRQTARRRFLARGTAAGSGLLIVTLYHQRGLANGTELLLRSSELDCTSIGRTAQHDSQGLVLYDASVAGAPKRVNCV
jgi:hypothetical protein